MDILVSRFVVVPKCLNFGANLAIELFITRLIQLSAILMQAFADSTWLLESDECFCQLIVHLLVCLLGVEWFVLWWYVGVFIPFCL